MPTKKPTCPWTKPQMRETVDSAIKRVGGRKAFDFMGRGMQEAIIDQALFYTVQDAAQFGHAVNFDEMIAARRVAYEIAGLWTEGCPDVADEQIEAWVALAEAKA